MRVTTLFDRVLGLPGVRVEDQVWLQADGHRVDCAGCGRVRTEQVPWARPGARASTAFEDQVAWLAQRMDKTSVAAQGSVPSMSRAAVVMQHRPVPHDIGQYRPLLSSAV